MTKLQQHLEVTPRMRRLVFDAHDQQCGAQALGIVTLVSFLVGLILAFIGAV